MSLMLQVNKYKVTCTLGMSENVTEPLCRVLLSACCECSCEDGDNADEMMTRDDDDDDDYDDSSSSSGVDLGIRWCLV